MNEVPPQELLRASVVFQGLSADQLAAAVDLLRPVSFSAGEVIVREGEPADRWYIIDDGLAAVTHTDLTGQPVTLAVLGPGQSFGERALVGSQPRLATVSALASLTAYALDRGDIQRVVSVSPEFADRLDQRLEVMSIEAALKRASPFASLPDAVLWSLAEQTQRQQVDPGAEVVREGDPGDCFYLVRSGRLEVRRRGRRVARLQPGDTFGEVALLTPSLRNATVRAVEKAELLVLTRAVFEAVTRDHATVAHHFRELVRIRFSGAPGQSLLLPDPLTTIMPLIGVRRRKRYWLVLAACAVVFALLSAGAALGGARSAQYPVMVIGSLIGPIVFVLYLVESHLLSERPHELIATAVFGAALGLPPAIFLQREAGLTPGSLLSAESIAAIEEIVKVLGVVWVLRRPQLRFRMDGIIYGAAAGMGFAAIETALYALARVETVGAFLGILWLRAVLSPFTHGTWTAIVCATIWQERGGGWRRGAWKIAAAFGAAIALHGLWDWQVLPLPWSFAWLLLVGIVGIVLLRAILQHAAQEEARAVAALAPEVAVAAVHLTDLRCTGCGRRAPAGAHYCPRCGLALRHVASA